MMRVFVGLLVFACAACGETASTEEAGSSEQAANAQASAAPAAPVQAAALMSIPEDPAAVKRLEAMGYTVHREENHLHGPGVKDCPAMAEGPVM